MGKKVHIIAELDKSQTVEYDPVKNPNYLSFYAKDSLGGNMKVIFKNSKPTDFERSERIVMEGTMRDDHFDCKNITLKCPSKYKDDKKSLEKNMTEQTYNSN